MVDGIDFDFGRVLKMLLCRRSGVCWDFARNIDGVLEELCGYREEMESGFLKRPALW